MLHILSSIHGAETVDAATRTTNVKKFQDGHELQHNGRGEWSKSTLGHLSHGKREATSTTKTICKSK